MAASPRARAPALQMGFHMPTQQGLVTLSGRATRMIIVQPAVESEVPWACAVLIARVNKQKCKAINKKRMHPRRMDRTEKMVFEVSEPLHWLACSFIESFRYWTPARQQASSASNQPSQQQVCFPAPAPLWWQVRCVCGDCDLFVRVKDGNNCC